MRTFLAIVGAITLLIVVSLIGMGIVAWQRSGPLGEEAKAYADEAIVAIATKWDAQALIERAAPEFKRKTPDAETRRIAQTASNHFGNLKKYDNNSKCIIQRQQYTTHQGSLVEALCMARAEFDRTVGTFRLSLIKRNDDWRLLGFNIQSDKSDDGSAPTPMVRDFDLLQIPDYDISFARRSIAVSTPWQDTEVPMGFTLDPLILPFASSKREETSPIDDIELQAPNPSMIE